MQLLTLKKYFFQISFVYLFYSLKHYMNNSFLRLFFILFTSFIIIGFALDDVFAPPSVNPDWQSYPYCPGGCSQTRLIEEWAKYYDIKGEEWMEQKKLELFNAQENRTLNGWIDSDPTKANQNVHTYYYILGEIPDFDGNFLSLMDNCPVLYFLNYAWQDCGSIFTWSILGIPLLVIIVAPIGSVLAFIVWRIRK